MIDKGHNLSISRQCALLEVPRSSFYYSPREEGPHSDNIKISEVHNSNSR